MSKFQTSIAISKQGLGCMSISEFYGDPIPDAEGIELIKTAFQQGINFFDTADVYGYGRNEILVGKALDQLMAKSISREELVIASKCGMVRDEHDPTKRGIDNSYDYIIHSCNKSLERLGHSVAYLDLYYLHRIEQHGRKIDESMQAMAELLKHNKIKAVGLSEANEETVRAANQALLKYTDQQHQLAAVQSEYSLMTRHIERNGVLKACQELGITLVAYSPLCRALLTGEMTNSAQFQANDMRQSVPRFQGLNFEYNLQLADKIRNIAQAKQCTLAQVALAWTMHQEGVIPIPGTTKLSHLLENIAANNVKLNPDELFFLNNLGEAKGYRYSEASMRAYGFESELEPLNKN